jgi:hypothetical protein
MTVLDTISPPRQLPPLWSDISNARVSFRQPVSSGGFVDAAWWPRSLDLTMELPPLLDELWTAGREITRVSYNLEFWEPAPRRLNIHGRTVKLGGYRWQNPLLVALVDSWGQERIDVLVIDPTTDPDIALRALALASRSDSTDRAERIMELAAIGAR